MNELTFGFLEEIHEIIQDLREKLNLGRETGTRILAEALNRHAGTTVYLPSHTKVMRMKRNEWIRKKFNGSNYGWLAQVTGLSERTIRRIVHE